MRRIEQDRTRQRNPKPPVAGPLNRFVRREDGTITVFGLMIFVLMVAIGGIAIDIMRYETQRVQLQYTMDRAVLAAASLTQSLDNEEVVESYFATSGLENYRLAVVDSDEGVNFRRVEGYAEAEIPSFFMHFFGVRVLSSPARSVAEERVRNVEISMVLDVSGSMGNHSRLSRMQTAARQFVSTVLEANEESETGNLVSVSIVPYNAVVNLGTPLENVFALDNTHTASSCVRFDPADFANTAVDPAVAIERIAHWDWNNHFRNQSHSRSYCPTDNTNSVMPFEHRKNVLHGYINSLTARGNTAIDLGMKVGVALLDPAAQSAVTSLVASNLVHADFGGRPVAFTDGDTVKVIVLMTDGENTDQWDMRNPYKFGDSPIFYNADDNRYSIYVDSRNEYWIANGNPANYGGYWSNEPFGGAANSEALSWAYLFGQYTGGYIAQNYLRVAADMSNDWSDYNDVTGGSDYIYANNGSANTNLLAICTAARTAGILVFTIGFEATDNGQQVMQQCATTDAHYYPVEGLEIEDAFASIANTINQLRLIQ